VAAGAIDDRRMDTGDGIRVVERCCHGARSEYRRECEDEREEPGHGQKSSFGGRGQMSSFGTGVPKACNCRAPAVSIAIAAEANCRVRKWQTGPAILPHIGLGVLTENPMSFRIRGLPATQFTPLFGLSDDDLSARHIQRVIADEPQSAPCRVTLADAEVGEEL